MKVKTLQELKAKVAAIAAPLYDKDSEAFGERAVYDELAKIINIQLNNASLIPKDFRNLVLYINGTNSYVSCHWYNLEKNDVMDSCGYTVVTFIKYQDEEIWEDGTLDEDFFFYGLIMDALEKYKRTAIKPLNSVILYECDEGDEVLPISF